MNKTPITVNLSEYPDELRPFLSGAELYDSSCSKAASVIFINSGGGFYLKRAESGALRKEAMLTKYFADKGLAPTVLSYITFGGYDYMLSCAANGEDGTHRIFLSSPERLCDVLAEAMRALHDTDTSGCPVPDRMSDYFVYAEKRYREGAFDPIGFSSECDFKTADKMWRFASERRRLLRSDTLIHGDFCLPNVILNEWKLASFIDIGNGGVGDRHIDLFWAAWSLCFNLKTDKYRSRLFDAYGRDKIDPEALLAVEAFEAFG